MNLQNIATRLGVSRNTVSRRLVEYGIPHRRKAETHIRHERQDFSGNLTEKAYLLGFRTGDLFVAMNKGAQSETVIVSCHSSRQEQIDLMRTLFEFYGHISVTEYSSGTQQVVAYLNQTFDFLLPRLKSIPSWITSSPTRFLAFVAGYIDAEGSFCVTRQGVALFQLKSSDVIILNQIHRGLTEHFGLVLPRPRCAQHRGEKSNQRYRLSQDVWVLASGAKATLHRLCKLLEPNLKHPKRCRDLRTTLDNVLSRGLT
jgi:hypothetical protein